MIEVGDVTTPGPCAGAYSRTKTWQARDCSGNLSALVGPDHRSDRLHAARRHDLGPVNGTVFAVGASLTFTGVVSDECSTPERAVAVRLDRRAGRRDRGRRCGVDQLRVLPAGRLPDQAGGHGRLRKRAARRAQTPEGFDWTVIVYDPNGGFVTGGGWIQSPPGRLPPERRPAGKGQFRVRVQVPEGCARIPTGETEFQFKAGDLNFHSTTYEWLVIGGAKAQYKGVGKINGAPGLRLPPDRRGWREAGRQSA